MAGEVDDVIAVAQPLAHLGHAEGFAHHRLDLQRREARQFIPQSLELLGDSLGLGARLGELWGDRPLLAAEVIQEGGRKGGVADDQDANRPGRPSPRLPQGRCVHEHLAAQGVAEPEQLLPVMQELPRVAHQFRRDLEAKVRRAAISRRLVGLPGLAQGYRGRGGMEPRPHIGQEVFPEGSSQGHDLREGLGVGGGVVQDALQPGEDGVKGALVHAAGALGHGRAGVRSFQAQPVQALGLHACG